MVERVVADEIVVDQIVQKKTTAVTGFTGNPHFMAELGLIDGRFWLSLNAHDALLNKTGAIPNIITNILHLKDIFIKKANIR